MNTVSLDVTLNHSSNIELEDDVLGAIFLEPKTIKQVHLKKEVFFSVINQYIYYLMKTCELKGLEVDAATILDMAAEEKRFDTGEVSRQVTHLVSTAFTASNIAYKLDKLQDLYMKREQIKMAHSILKNVLNDSYDELKEKITKTMNNIEASRPTTERSHISNYMRDLLEDLETPKGEFDGSPTHMRDLDRIMNGMRKQELVIVGANPSVGKTVLATNIAERHALKNKGITVIFSLEMSGLSLAKRMISSLTNIHSNKVRNALERFEDKDWNDTSTAIGAISQTKTEIFEKSGVTIEYIKRNARAVKDKYSDTNEHMVILIDYLGLIRKEDKRTNTREHMGQLAIELKQLAKELDCTIIALSQLSRDNEKNQRKPIMADLKESGDIEAAADTIILLHREDYQGRETEKKDIIEIIIAKNRNGAVGSAEMKFIKHLSKFIDIG